MVILSLKVLSEHEIMWRISRPFDIPLLSKQAFSKEFDKFKIDLKVLYLVKALSLFIKTGKLKYTPHDLMPVSICAESSYS